MKTLFFANAIVSWVFGFALLLIPAVLLSGFGMTYDPSTGVIARLLGGALLGLGVLAWFARNAAPSEALRAITLGFAVIATLGCLVSIFAVLTSTSNALGWLPVLLYGFFAVGFGMLASGRAPVRAHA